MVLTKIFHWIFELPLSAIWQTPTPKPKETGWHYSTMTMIVFVSVGTILILFIFIYAYAAEARRYRRRFAIPELPALVSDKKRRVKRRKSTKTGKQRMTKAQRLLEVNRKWSAMYCSPDNSDCEEPEDIATVPFGSLEITEAKKVSFRDSIQDVYFIESKEEMKRLERLQNLGYDVTITRPLTSARDHACKKTTKTAVCEEKETVLAPTLFSTFENYINKKEEPDISPKKWLNVLDFQIEDAKTFNDEGSFENRIFKDEERLLEIPSFIESSV
ncbi:uncharacterized protein LOC144666011 [Oculina patagonica]